LTRAGRASRKAALASTTKAQPPPPRESEHSRLGGFLPPLLIAVATAAAYANSFSGPFVLDDVPSIAANPTIRHLGSALAPSVATTGGGRPVLNLSLAVNYAVSGSAVWSYHALNLAIHVLAGLLLYAVVRRTLGSRAVPAAIPIAFSAALLWSLHPLQTESVTYIIQRAESLMGLFYLLTLYAFIRGAAAQGARARVWFALSVGACLLGMGTKEVMVSAPLVVLLYDRTFLAGSLREAWRRPARVHAALFSTWLFLAVLVASTHGRGGTAGFGTGVSWRSYALTQFAAVAHYLRLALWPYPLVFDYGTAPAGPSLGLALCAVLVTCLAAMTFWALVRRPALGFLGACFFALLAPSSSVVPVATEIMAEHRMYLALAPVVVLGVAAVFRGLGRAALPLCVAVSAGLLGATWLRNETYRTETDLWGDAVVRRPDNDRARTNLGNALSSEGRTAEAVAQLEVALRLNPQNVDAHNDLGNALNALGRTAEANAQFEEARRLNPGSVEAHNNLGNALSAQGRGAEAVAQYEEALRLNPDYAEARNNLGNVLSAQGRSAEAIPQFEAALRLRPEVAEVHNNLGNALKALGRTPEAIAQYEEAIRLNPGYAAAQNNLGNALNADGRGPEAVAHYEAALRLSPESAAFQMNLAVTLLKIPGREAEAVPHLREALRLEPGNALARQILERIGAAGR
jgi:tetratricopeptide (TPR) repeat protein